MVSREVRLRSRPAGAPAVSDFEIAEVEVPPPAPGEVRVRNLWMSVDPYMGNRLYDRPNYIPPFRLGRALDGGAVGEVVDSGVEHFAPGDLVFSQYGWREAFVAQSRRLTRLPQGPLPPSAHLGIAGVTGMTAYVALFRIAQLKPGEALFVSAAAGAVGSAACQMAKIIGCKVIGSAGGADKRAYLQRIGVDYAIDYRTEPFLEAALARAAPEGIDVYLDNVGGRHLEAAIANMRLGGRIAVSGMIGSYGEVPEPGPSNLFQCVAKRLRLEGFILNDHEEAVRETSLAAITCWIGTGRLTWEETVMEGIDRAPEALLSLFEGRNLGKMLVRLEP